MLPAHQAVPNARLRRQRLRRGWSLQRVADELQKLCEHEGRRVGVTASMVGKWERGFKRPSPFYQEKLCSLYDRSAEELGLVDAAEQAVPTWFDDNGTLADTLESWRHDVERRAFFRHLSSFAGAAMFAPAIDALGPQELHERLAQALDRPSRVDQATMGHVETVTDQFRRLDDRIGSRDLLGPVLGHLRFITRLLQGSQPTQVHRRLCQAAAQVAQLAGWLSFDANLHADARAYYDVAVKAADEGNDRALSAYVRGHGDHPGLALPGRGARPRGAGGGRPLQRRPRPGRAGHRTLVGRRGPALDLPLRPLPARGSEGCLLRAAAPPAGGQGGTGRGPDHARAGIRARPLAAPDPSRQRFRPAGRDRGVVPPGVPVARHHRADGIGQGIAPAP